MSKVKVSNAEIWSASQPMQSMLGQKFPVMVSYKLAKLANKLQEPIKVIDETRRALVKKHGKKDEKSGQDMVLPGTPEMEAFSKEWVELMTQVQEIDIEPVRIPEKVAATCDKCHHNMDRMLELEPAILLALDKFIEVV